MRQPDFSNEQAVSRRPHTVAPSLASVRLVLVYPVWAPILPGSDAGLSNIIRNTMNVLRRAGVHCEAWQVKNDQDLLAKMEEQKWTSDRPITHVVINPPLGYDHPKIFQDLAHRWPDVEFVQLNHSGMAYISINPNAFEVIHDLLNLEMSSHNVLIAGNNPRYTSWLEETFGKPALLLPNLYDTTTYLNPVTSRCHPDPIRIGSFGEARPWKNQLIAAESALTLARRLGVRVELYVIQERWPNTPSWEQAQARVQLYSNQPNARLVTIPWEVWPKFRKTVGSMDIMLSPSFDETFCCIVADGIAEGVPSVVTGAIEWAPRDWWAEPWEWSDIVSRATSLLQNRIGAVQAGRKALDAYVKSGVQHWIEYLTR